MSLRPLPRRWWLALALGGAFVLAPMASVHAASPNPIVLENQQPGTTAWQFTDYNKAEHHEIEGYASLTSVNQGGTISFMVSLSSSAQYTMDFYRLGWYPTGTNPDGTSCAPSCGGRLMLHVGPLNGATQPACPRVTTSTSPDFGLTECNWSPSYTLSVPTTWTTGVYIVKLTRLDGSHLQNWMTFVVRSDSSSSAVLYSLDVNTWEAYNFWGGAGNNDVGISLYGRTNDVTYAGLSGSRAYTVSFDRPYLDNGAIDGAGTMMLWDFPLIRWMESQGYDISYATDVDLETNPGLLAGHRVFVNAGHDEYYSDAMRTNIKNAIANGVNMAFFSANNIYYRITYAADANGQPDRRIHCSKGALDQNTVEWRNLTPAQPENAVIGVMQNGVASSRPFLVYDASNWIYSGTGLVNYTGNGTTGVVTSGAGQNALPGLVGYEFDERAANASSLSAFKSSEPPGLQQVAHSFVPSADNGVNAWSDATVYTAPSGAIVFAAGTIQWAFAVDNGIPDGFCDCDHTVASPIGQKITANVLNRLSAPAGPAPFVALTPPSLSFASQPIGTTSSSQSSTLKNAGTAALSISSISTTGTNAADFGVSSTCPIAPATLAAGATCTVNATFAPSGTGTRAAAVSIADNAADTPQSISLTGTGVASAPAVTLAPTSLGFAAQRVATTSAAQSATLTNTGNASLSITSLGITGTNAADFAQTNTCPATLAAGASCSISVTFTPGATGSRSAAVSIADNASGSPQSLPLSGTGTAPAVTLSPTSLAFGAQAIGTTSAAQSVTLTNSGTAPLAIGGIGLAGANAGDFGESNTCAATLAVGASCSISVTFAPTAGGVRAATVQVTDDAATSPQSIGVTGTGAAPAVSLAPTTLTFPSQLTGTTSGAQSTTLTNTGAAPLTITAVATTGANAGDFSASSTCPISPTTLAAGASCSITVTFTPSDTGTRVAAVQVTDNAADTPQTVGLTGTGAAPSPTVSLTPSALSFGSAATGTTTATQTSVLKNTGTAPLDISGVSLAGANPGDFTFSSTCPATLAVGATCSLTAAFAPTAAGPRAAALQIADDAADSPQSLGLSGTGVAPAPQVSLSPPSLSFGAQRVGTSSNTQSATLQNTGNAVLLISSLAASGANSGDFFIASDCPLAPAGLAPGATCTLAVTFTPGATGVRSASIAIADNAGDSPQSVGLSGTGTAPAVSFTPTAGLSFGSVLLGSTSAGQTETLTNTGTAPLAVSSISITGTNAGDFAQTNTCPASLAAGASCTVTVTFTPSAAGPRAATLQVADDAAGSPQSVPLSGTGSTSSIAFDKNLGQKTDNVGTTSMTLTTSAAAVAGSRVFLFVEWNNSTRVLSSVSGGGLTWSVDYQAKESNNNHLAIASAAAPSGVASATVLTATFSGSVTHGLIAAASFTGVSPTTDGTTSTTAAGTKPWSATLTTTNPTDLVLGFSTIDANTTDTPTAPNTEIHDFGDANYYGWATTVYQITSGTPGQKTVNGTWAANTGATGNLTIAAAYRGS